MRRFAFVVIAAAGCSRGVEVGLEDATVADADAFTEGDAGTDAETETDAGTETETDAGTETDADADAAADADADAAADADADVGDGDAAPAPILLGTVPRPRDIAVGGGYAFVTSFDGAIFRLPITGGTATKIASPEWPTYVAVDSTHAYWTDLASAGNPGSVGRVPIGGGMTELLATGLQGPNSCTLFGGRVYFAHGTTTGLVQSVPVAGGTVATVATTSPYPYYAAANGSRICWATDGTSIACSVEGTVTTLVSGEAPRISFLALDETHAFYSVRGSTLRRVALAGGAPTTIDAGGDAPLGQEILLDGANVYWSVANEIRRVNKTASAGATVYRGSVDVMGIAVDATHVYWTSAADTQIRKLPK